MEPRPSDLFFKLMKAAQEQGIEQCKQSFWLGDQMRPTSVCVIGLTWWGVDAGIIAETERIRVSLALPQDKFILNDKENWTFADFYSYLQEKEEIKTKEEEGKKEEACL